MDLISLIYKKVNFCVLLRKEGLSCFKFFLDHFSFAVWYIWHLARFIFNDYQMYSQSDSIILYV